MVIFHSFLYVYQRVMDPPSGTSSSGTALEAVETSQPQSRRVVLGRGMKKSWPSPSRRSFQAQHLLGKAGKIPVGCGKGLEIYRKLLGFL